MINTRRVSPTILVELSKMSLSDSQAERHRQLYNLINDIERVGDHGTNVGELLEHKAVNQIMFSEAANKELLEFLDYTVETLNLALQAWRDNEAKYALAIKEREAASMRRRRRCAADILIG